MEPWQLIQNFTNITSNRAANARNTADNVLLKLFGHALARQDMGIQQGYNLDTLAKRNEYATAADTTAYERQLARDAAAYANEDKKYARNRADALVDAQTSQGYRQDNIRLEQELLKDRELAERSPVPGVPRRYGVFNPTTYEQGTVGRESGGNAAAKNPNSSATGLHQFTTDTWNRMAQMYPELGLTPNGRTDPEQSTRAFRVFTRDNQRVLQQNGIPVTNGTTYAAHFLGAAGAVRALRAPDNTPMAAVVGPGVVEANPFLAKMTVGSFKQWTESKYAGSNQSVDEVDGRRYVGGGGSYSDQVLGQPTANTAATDANSSELAPVSDTFQKWLDEQGLEAVARVSMTEAQMGRVPPGLIDLLKVDPFDTSNQNGTRPRAEYIEVRPRQIQDPNMTGLPKENITKGPSVAPAATAGKTVYKDGKRVQLRDGAEIELPD